MDRVMNPETGALRARLSHICREQLNPEAAAVVESLARPAVRMHHTDDPTRSHLGGGTLSSTPTSGLVGTIDHCRLSQSSTWLNCRSSTPSRASRRRASSTSSTTTKSSRGGSSLRIEVGGE